MFHKTWCVPAVCAEKQRHGGRNWLGWIWQQIWQEQTWVPISPLCALLTESCCFSLAKTTSENDNGDCGIWLGFCWRFKFVRSCSDIQLSRNLQTVTGLSLHVPNEYLSLCASPVLLSLLFPLCRMYFFIRIWLHFIDSNNSHPGMTAVELKSVSLDRCPDWVICCLLCLDKFYFLHVLLFNKLQPQISVFSRAIKNPSLSASLSPIMVSCGKSLELMCASCFRGSYQTRLGAVLWRALLTWLMWMEAAGY